MLRWSHAAQAGARSLLVTIERDRVRLDVPVVLVPGDNFFSVDPSWWVNLPFILTSVGTALLLLVRAGHWHLARRYYVGNLLWAFTLADTLGIGSLQDGQRLHPWLAGVAPREAVTAPLASKGGATLPGQQR